LRVEDEAPVRIAAGDVCLISARQFFTVSGDLDTPPIEAASVFGPASPIPQLGDGAGEDCVQIGGFVKLDPLNGRLLADVLPPLIHVRAGSAHAGVLQALLEQMVRERQADLPGAALISSQLAQLVFVLILRAYVEDAPPMSAGWLRAVSDRRLAPALKLMHGEPARDWQLAELAKAAAMSRTTFAERFREAAGVAPLAYLASWRMRLAERALREADTPLSVLAPSLGYTSESAFSNAFKRATGMAPTRYRNVARAGLAEATGAR
jgi:AraC-like DNA-binding protein